MNDRIFLDSNLLVYFATEPAKVPIVENLIRQNNGAFASTQTLNEFSNVCLKRGLLNFSEVHGAVEQFILLLRI